MRVHRLPSSFKMAQMMGSPADYPLLMPPPFLGDPFGKIARPDVVHAMHPFLAGRLAQRWARSIGAPLFYTAHTQYEEYLHYSPLPKGFSASFIKRHVGEFSNEVDAVLTPGKAMKTMLEGYGCTQEITLLRNPVDLAAYQTGATEEGRRFREKHGLGEGPIVMYLGRIAPEKNLPLLLQAFARLRESSAWSEAQLVIVGMGSLLETIRGQLPAGAVALGGIPYDEVPQALFAADLFATPSKSEVLPMSMIEAMAAATPMVSVQSPAAEELIEHQKTGLICEATPLAMAEALAKALEPSTHAKMSAAAARKAEDFSMLRVAARLEEMYTALIGEQRKGKR